ncbi:MAG: hypothetical protein PW789_11720 [Edaphobacter sp.]|uniref:hypothetical protein n=1 Tax=Edaphobacter sp. TaxID=1934404 RepID=UPI0023970AB8|nr:hypothetical protein [Edaphobacter sp.]MDE1177254.1 hypothetical protein [Edaphobacter sp.]
MTRNGKTLPIASVPNLQPGDKLWLFADLPRTQSVHYLLVSVFLRGTTNPPPETWFTKIETWNKKVREEGVTITVPDEAQQAILFLAPETGGDYTTLRSAVQGRPGIFVRASQDLSEAGFEQQRIEKYLDLIKDVPPDDAKALQEHSTLLSRTLNLKPNADCFKKPADQQFSCLTQTGSQTLLDDGHGQTVASLLSNGSASDFINQASYTGMAGAGMYSAYVGAVVDLIRLTSNLHTAQYQYIPAIAFPQQEQMNLRLNTPPSFHNPKSVIVIGLPAIQKAVPPPLRASDPKHITCLLEPRVAVPVEGAPLVFSTAFAHDLYLHVTGGSPRPDIPLVADAYKGGLVIAPEKGRKLLPTPGAEPMAPPVSGKDDSGTSKSPSDPTAPHTPVSGTIVGYWGFDQFTGPTLPLQDFNGTGWKLSSDGPLIAGRDNHLTLVSTGTACIEKISVERPSGRIIDVQWKPSEKGASVVDVTLSLKSIDPGSLHLDVHQYGSDAVSSVSAQTFSEPAQLNALALHAGDTTALLNGTSLDQVKQLTIDNLAFHPVGDPAAAEHGQTLTLTAAPSDQAPKMQAGDHLIGHVSLRDGRTLTLPITVAPPRPTVTLLNKSIGKGGNSPIHLANADDLPIDQKLTFALRSQNAFPRDSKIEIASPDDALHTTLSVSSGSLILQNSHTILGTLDPLKSFGTSGFGPLRLRPVSPDGTAGDWIPLATLVRLPSLDNIHCPSDPSAGCTLTGSSLYLVDAVAIDSAFTTPVDVPEGFVGNTINLPRPPKSGFYLKLRDEPESSNLVNLPVQIQRGTQPAPTPAPAVAAPPPAATPAPETPSTVPAASTPPPQQQSPAPQAH